MEHACVIWSPYYNIYMNKLESVQKQFLLFALRNLGWRSYSLPNYEHRLLLLDMCPLKLRRDLFDVMFIFDLLRNNIDCLELSNNLRIKNNSRNLRHNRYLIENFHHNNYVVYITILWTDVSEILTKCHMIIMIILRDKFKSSIQDKLRNIMTM